jgi:formamidopyrimidine-DNA glycosylase
VPELPEVEVLVRFLRPLLRRKLISSVDVRRRRVIRPASVGRFKEALQGARILDLNRRGKYLVFELQPRIGKGPRVLVGHLGMTGRMYVLPLMAPLPKHAAIVARLGREQFVFEDTRYFGRMTLDHRIIDHLGPEPLSPQFRQDQFGAQLARSRQPIKVKLLDQSLVAGIGNIYASEALFIAGISPLTPARSLAPKRVAQLWKSIRQTLKRAIRFGSTVPLDFVGIGAEKGLFYYGAVPEEQGRCQERLLVYDRKGKPCARCGGKIKRIVQAARSTFYCAHCQR